MKVWRLTLLMIVLAAAFVFADWTDGRYDSIRTADLQASAGATTYGFKSSGSLGDSYAMFAGSFQSSSAANAMESLAGSKAAAADSTWDLWQKSSADQGPAWLGNRVQDGGPSLSRADRTSWGSGSSRRGSRRGAASSSGRKLYPEPYPGSVSDSLGSR